MFWIHNLQWRPKPAQWHDGVNACGPHLVLKWVATRKNSVAMWLLMEAVVLTFIGFTVDDTCRNTASV